MVSEKLSRYFFYPLWDWKDKSHKLKEFSLLQKSQWLPLDELQRLQWQKVSSLLHYSYEYSPYYKNLFDAHDIKPSKIKTHTDFQKIPITTKLDIRNNLSTFISAKYNQENLVHAKTGGSTGVSLDLYFDEACQESRNAAAIRSDMWAGWLMGQMKAALWGNPPVARSLKQKIRSHCLDRVIYLDTMDLNDQSMFEFVEKWRDEKVKSVFGHAHSIFIFTQFLVENDITDLRPNAIVATSMMLLKHERQLIEEVFGCKVTDRYGCEEVGLIACECEQHDGMHLNLEHLYIEFLDDDGKPVLPGEEGKVTVTDLNNYGMPLIRYQVGDVGVFLDRQCSCGRGLPMMDSLKGRVADFLLMPSGAKVSGISLIERTLTKIPGIEQMQIVQVAFDKIIINRVKGKDFSKTTDGLLTDEFKDIFGVADIIINDIDTIPKEISGKYRFSICEIA